jgi:DNA-directed RNA polymerase specialized sigma24 family protein
MPPAHSARNVTTTATGKRVLGLRGGLAASSLADSDRALAYLHQAVVTRSRSALRHRAVAGKRPPVLAPGTPGAGPAALTELEPSVLISALRTLAPRQREALVLTYYAGLPEAQIASVMRISTGAVKSHTTRAMSALRDHQLAVP